MTGLILIRIEMNITRKKRKITTAILVTLAIATAFVVTITSVTNNYLTVETSAWSGPQVSTEGSYYEGARGLKGSALKAKLKTIIGTNVSTNYDWYRYEAADEAEGQSTKVLQIYTRTTIAKTAHVSGSLGWNREHSYPQSKIGSPATSDNHHIFASDNKVNNIRGNKLFGVVTTKNSSTDVQDSLGNTIDAYTTSTYFEPGASAKGEVARATLYLNTLYGYSITGNFQSQDLCLDWAKDYPVTNREIYRNNIVYTLQKNRNPFIDHPEFIDMVYDPSYSGEGALEDDEVTTPTPEEEVDTWALDFLNQTSTGCQNKSASQLQDVWNDVAASHNSLSDEAKMLIGNVTANATGSNIENALARYHNIIANYQLQAFITGVQSSSNIISEIAIRDNNYVFVFAIGFILLFATGLIFAMVFVFKKR
jgi:endonuclease I